MQIIFNSSQWLSSPKGYWTIYHEYRRIGVDVQYRFYWKVWISSGSWFYDALTLRLFLNGIQHDVTVKGYSEAVKGWSYEGTTEWYTVSNKTSGNVPFYAQLWDVSAIPNVLKVTSSSYSLNVPPAFATMTSATDFTDEGNPSFTFSNPANAPLSCWIELNPVGDHLCERTLSGTSGTYTWELTEDERNQLREACEGNSCTCRFGLYSTIGETTNASYLDKTLTIVNANPTFETSRISYTDENKVLYGITGNTADNKKIVQNQSSLSVTFGAAKGNKGATISQYTLTLNGVTKTASNAGTVSFGVINSTQNVTLSVTVKDSRGNTTTVEKEIAVLAWALPIFTATVVRENNYEDKTFLKVDASISSVDGKNHIKSITYQYMEVGGGYGQPVPIENKTEYTISLDKNKEFFFLITVEDAFDYDNKELHLPKGKFPLFIDTEKYAVGVNEFPEEGEALRVAGGVARFDDGIVLVSASKRFLLSVNDSGVLSITEME